MNQLLNVSLQKPQYQISFQRKRDRIGLIASIRRQFAYDLASQANLPEHQQIWDFIESHLQIAPIHEKDTYESLAKRYKQSQCLLQELNHHMKTFAKSMAK